MYIYIYRMLSGGEARHLWRLPCVGVVCSMGISHLPHSMSLYSRPTIYFASPLRFVASQSVSVCRWVCWGHWKQWKRREERRERDLCTTRDPSCTSCLVRRKGEERKRSHNGVAGFSSFICLRLKKCSAVASSPVLRCHGTCGRNYIFKMQSRPSDFCPLWCRSPDL